MSAIDLSSYEHVRLSLDDSVLTATITNPGRKNAVNDGILYDLGRLWRDVDRDRDIRVVVFTGDGDAFCAGADLRRMKRTEEAVAPPPRHFKKAYAKECRDRIFDILDCETPVVAKVRGPAYGMGVNLALACDFVIAADDARFADNHVRNGIVAGDGGVVLFPLAMGFRRAKEMLMLGEPISGTEAAEAGLINRAVPSDALDATVDEYVRKLLAGAPLALSWTKLSLNVLLKQMTLGAFETSVAYDMMSMGTEDVREGAAAFLAKRPPNFSGR